MECVHDTSINRFIYVKNKYLRTTGKAIHGKRNNSRTFQIKILDNRKNLVGKYRCQESFRVTRIL